ncbi:MAG: ABC transporter permease [Ignavibacteriae bacterium]|nr:ABC transporter permease [Ignavibacteriota bacterium]
MKTGRVLKVAFKGLGKNKLRTFLMMIGIVIGITALTLIVSAGLGAQNRVMERVKKFGLESMMVFAGAGREVGQPTSGQPATTLSLEDATMLKQEIKTVADVAPFGRKGQSEVKFQEKSTTTTVFGVTPSWAPVWDWDAAEGDFITDEDMSNLARICVIGPTVQKELFGTANPIGEQLRIGSVQFEIRGVMQAKGTSPAGGDMDDRIYIPLTTFMRRVANVDYISAIKIRLNTSKDMAKTAADINALLRERHKLAVGTPDDFTITTPTEVTKMAEKVAGTFNIFLVLVAVISLIAGGVVVANIMLISVNERRKEIGLRKAVGARRKDIIRQFLYEATAVTLTGGVIGIVLGAIGAKILEAFTQMPMAVSWESVALGVVFSTLVGILAGLQPAKKAAALQPIEALR